MHTDATRYAQIHTDAHRYHQIHPDAQPRYTQIRPDARAVVPKARNALKTNIKQDVWETSQVALAENALKTNIKHASRPKML